MQKPKYITNKDLLREIHKSKMTYCYYEKLEHANFDVIVGSIDLITEELIERVLLKKNTPKGKQVLEKISVRADLVFRVMTHDHIPLDPDRKRKARNTDKSYARTNFPPFKHYVLRDGKLAEVGRSHWKGDLDEGAFCLDNGAMSNQLAMMFMLLVERYSRRANWRNYTYVDEMRSHALLQLSQIGLQFDESKSDNPFAFFTTAIRNCLSGETEILTREFGAVAIADVAGQDVTLLDGNGDWVKSHIYDYGEQETQLTYFQSGGQKIGLWSTLNHGWVRDDGQKMPTLSFDGRTSKIADLRPSKLIADQNSYTRGVIHGVIYGDGTALGKSFEVRLCGEKAELSRFFEGHDQRFPASAGGEPIHIVRQPWADFKELPDAPGADLDYLLGFVRGWFAADGCLSKAQTATLCGDAAEHAWLAKWGPLAGWHVNNFTVLPSQTNFGVRKKASVNIHLRKSSLDASDFLRSFHRERWDPSARSAKGKSKKYDWDHVEQLRAKGASWDRIAGELGAKKGSLASAYCQYRKTRETLVQPPKRVWSVYGSRQPEPPQRRMERVYCPLVTTTNSMALANGVHSAQCFTRVLNLERRNQNIRDDMLIVAGASPSYTRQIENELEHRFPGAAPKKGTPGRKPAAAKPAP